MLKMFGLSQPTPSAEWEKMNSRGLARSSKASLVAENFVEDFFVLQHGVLAFGVFVAAGLGEVVALTLLDLRGRGIGAEYLTVNGGVFLAEEDFDDAFVADVVVHLVNEYERQALDALRGEQGLFLEVAADEPLKLLAEEAGDVAVALFEDEFDAVGELHVILPIVQALPDALDGVVAVADVGGFFAEVVADFQPVGFLPLEPVAIHTPDGELGFDRRAVGLNGGELDLERGLVVLLGDGEDFDLLHHAVAIRIEGRETERRFFTTLCVAE